MAARDRLACAARRSASAIADRAAVWAGEAPRGVAPRTPPCRNCAHPAWRKRCLGPAMSQPTLPEMLVGRGAAAAARAAEEAAAAVAAAAAAATQPAAAPEQAAAARADGAAGAEAGPKQEGTAAAPTAEEPAGTTTGTAVGHPEGPAVHGQEGPSDSEARRGKAAPLQAAEDSEDDAPLVRGGSKLLRDVGFNDWLAGNGAEEPPNFVNDLDLADFEAQLNSFSHDPDSGGAAGEWSPKDREVASQLQAMCEGKSSARDAASQRMVRSLDAGAKKSYAAMATQEKAAFRARWAGAQMKLLAKKYSRLRSWQEIDEECGEYLSFPQVLAAQGGETGAHGRQNCLAALRYCARAAKMGRPAPPTKHSDDTRRQQGRPSLRRRPAKSALRRLQGWLAAFSRRVAPVLLRSARWAVDHPEPDDRPPGVSLRPPALHPALPAELGAVPRVRAGPREAAGHCRWEEAPRLATGFLPGRRGDAAGRT